MSYCVNEKDVYFVGTTDGVSNTRGTNFPNGFYLFDYLKFFENRFHKICSDYITPNNDFDFSVLILLFTFRFSF